MNNEEEMLGFVKAKLEEGEGVSPEALSRILAAADGIGTERRRLPLFLPRRVALAAATLAVAACGWYFANGSADVRRENAVANVIALLNVADGGDLDSAASLSDALCAWQDAPTLAAD